MFFLFSYGWNIQQIIEVHIDFCSWVWDKLNRPVKRKLLYCMLSSEETQLLDEIFKILPEMYKIYSKDHFSPSVCITMNVTPYIGDNIFTIACMKTLRNNSIAFSYTKKLFLIKLFLILNIFLLMWNPINISFIIFNLCNLNNLVKD